MLFAIAGISMSFAGFAGLYMAFVPRDSGWGGRQRGQIMSIITFALTAMFSALTVVPLASLLGAETAIRAMSAVVLVVEFYSHQLRIGTAWTRWNRLESLNRRDFWILGAPFALLAIVEQLLLVAAFLQASQDLYALALIAMLGGPGYVFTIVGAQIGMAARES